MPSDAENKSVTWASANTAIATVASDGKKTAVTPGTATIIVKTIDGEKSNACDVIVEATLLKDINNISDLTYTTNIPMDEFTVTWSGVDNAAGYKYWYIVEGDDYEAPADPIDNGDGTWSAKSSTAIGLRYTHSM